MNNRTCILYDEDEGFPALQALMTGTPFEPNRGRKKLGAGKRGVNQLRSKQQDEGCLSELAARCAKTLQEAQATGDRFVAGRIDSAGRSWLMASSRPT